MNATRTKQRIEQISRFPKQASQPRCQEMRLQWKKCRTRITAEQTATRRKRQNDKEAANETIKART